MRFLLLSPLLLLLLLPSLLEANILRVTLLQVVKIVMLMVIGNGDDDGNCDGNGDGDCDSDGDDYAKCCNGIMMNFKAPTSKTPRLPIVVMAQTVNR